jgi:signal transduction histidine kinase
MIVHDLRTPLTSFLSGLQVVPLVGDLNDKQNECLDIATQGGESLLGMINELLDISKIEDGSLQLSRKDVDLCQLAEAAIAQVEHLLHQKNLTLQREFKLGFSNLFIDEEKLVRVLVNLLGNAIKFTPQRGTITMRVQSDETGATVSTIDTGEGIPPEYFERIFEKFGQVETRKSGRKMSTGLGLTFCKMVVEKHGGRIWVESEPGKGSTFSFHLPAGR